MIDNRYPKAKYNVDGSHCVVKSEDEDLAQDRGVWFDHPKLAAEAALIPIDSDESWQASEAILSVPKRRGRPPKAEEVITPQVWDRIVATKRVIPDDGK